MNKIITLTESNFEDVLASHPEVLVDFWAEWCGPCKMIAPMLDEMSSEGGIQIAKVNIDDEPGLAQRFGVRGIPTLSIFVDGKVEGTKVGAISKSMLNEFVAKTLK